MPSSSAGDGGALPGVQPDGPIHRIGRDPDPWIWPDWRLAGPSRTFGNRWDDPQGQYRVLYACSDRVGAFLETLARFRPPAGAVAAALTAPAGEEDTLPLGVVPPTWRAGRRVGRAVLAGTFVDVGQHAALAYFHDVLGPDLGPILAGAGIAELDAAAIRLRAPRAVTQAISRHVYEMATAAGRARFAGIAYRSRLGDDLTNWAIFEPAAPVVEMPFTVLEREPIAPDDPDLLRACALLGLRPADA